MLRMTAVLFLAVLVLHASSLAKEPSFTLLGWPPDSNDSRASDISGDGTTVVGGRHSFVWKQSTGMVPIPGVQAQAVSYDGSVVVGITDWVPTEAYMWTSSGGFSVLGDLPGGDVECWPQGVSADGSVVVGHGSTDAGVETWRWTQATGIVSLGRMSAHDTAAQGISADGSVIVGYAIVPYVGDSAWRWTEQSGYVSIGRGRAYGVSSDGSTIVGQTSQTAAMIWTESTGQQVIGALPGFTYSQFSDVSADGAIAVGASYISSSNPEAMILDAENGLRSLEEVLTTVCGLDLAGWELGFTTGISDDGTTIVGIGTDPSGQSQAWMAVTPEPATVVLLAAGGAALCMRRWQGTKNRGTET